MPQQIRIPPHDILAEQALLCSCLIDPRVISRVAAIVQPDDFYREAHSLIFSAMLSLGEDTTPATISGALKSKGNLEAAGGEAYFFELDQASATSQGWQVHAETLRTHSVKRQIINLCSDIAQKSYQAHQDPEESILNLRAGIEKIIQSGANTETVNMRRLYNEIYDDLYTSKTDPGYTLGLDCIDEHFYLEPGCSHIVAAESGTGKSAFCLQVADHVARTYGTTLFFSMESTVTKLGIRQIARHAHIALTRLNKRVLYRDDTEDLDNALSACINTPLLLIDDTGVQTVDRAIAYCEAVAAGTPVHCIVFDYLQLFSVQGRPQNRHLEISEIAKKFNFLAKQLNVPVIVVSQLGKEIEKRTQRRPQLGDLKECVAAGSLVYTDKGPRRIRDLLKPGECRFKVRSYDIAKKKTVYIKPERVVHTGRQRCFKIRTKSGKYLVLSENSYVHDGTTWKMVKDLKAGDNLLIDRAIPNTRMGVCHNTGQTHIAKGNQPWNKNSTSSTDNRIKRLIQKREQNLNKNSPIYPTARNNILPLGTKKSNRGYILIYKPDWPSSGGREGPWKGYVFEHRYAMESTLGRMLKRSEIIHHLDGDKENNELSNLLLCKDAREHERIHQKEQRFVERLLREGKVYFDEKAREFRIRRDL